MHELKSKHFQMLEQYHFEREVLRNYFNEYAPLFSKMDDTFTTESFIKIRNGDEHYLIHKDSGFILNWYKHIGRTNTCNKDINLNDLKELLILLNEDILSEKDYFFGE